MDMPRTVPPVRVWDLPTRLFHWLWVACFAVAWFSHGSDRYLDVHVYAGYLFFGLLGFRLVWGFRGSHFACFRSFRFGPKSVFAYLRGLVRGKPIHFRGHNPVGAWVIFALLGLGLGVSSSGFSVLGLEEGHGPLGAWFDPARGVWWGEIHEVLGVAMLPVVALHIAWVLVSSRVHRENPIRAMLDGLKPGHDYTQRVIYVGEHAGAAIGLSIAVLTALAVFFTPYLIAAGQGTVYLPFRGPQLADNPLWREKCGSCHVAYHPVLLPRRSWRALFAAQPEHFGENLVLDEEICRTLKAFHLRHAAETLRTEASYRISISLGADKTPLRITETPYWREKHAEIDEAIWHHKEVRSRANCNACHLDAAQGTYADAAMRIP